MRALRALSLFVLPLVASCADSDAVSIRVRIAPELSGEIFASALSMPDEPAPLEGAAQGVRWEDRARLEFGAGRFADVNALVFEDLRFSAASDPQGMSYVRVVLPRGPTARWYRLFTTGDDARRQRMARALDPGGSADRVGATVKLVIETPGDIASTGVNPSVRGVRTDTQKREASLLVPFESVATGEGELVWNVTW